MQVVPQLTPAGSGINNAGIWPVAHQPAPVIDRKTDRNVLLLTDPQGNLYWVNVDHIREVQRAGAMGDWRIAGDPI
jgi:hypothetical protein